MKNTEHNNQVLWDNDKKCNICVIGIPEGEERGGAEEIFKTIMTKNFLELMSNIETGRSENINQDKCQRNYTSAYHFQTTER